MGVYNVNEFYNETVSNVTATPSVEVGRRRTVNDEEYLYVYNAGSSTAGVNKGVVVSAVSGYSVTVSSVTMVDICVGHVKHTAIPTGSYGWVCTRGWIQADAHADQSFAAGALGVLAHDGALTNKSISTGFVAPAHAKAMAAVASGASGTFFIKCF